MRTFKQFPEKSICKMCGTNTNKECVLVPIDGTQDGFNTEALPVHTDCIKEGKLRYNPDANIFYRVGVEEKE